MDFVNFLSSQWVQFPPKQADRQFMSHLQYTAPSLFTQITISLLFQKTTFALAKPSYNIKP